MAIGEFKFDRPSRLEDELPRNLLLFRKFLRYFERFCSRYLNIRFDTSGSTPIRSQFVFEIGLIALANGTRIMK